MLGIYLIPRLISEVNIPYLAALIVLPPVLSAWLYFKVFARETGVMRWLSFSPLVVGALLGYGPFSNVSNPSYQDFNNIGSKLEILHRGAFVIPIVCLVALLAYDFVRMRQSSSSSRTENIL